MADSTHHIVIESLESTTPASPASGVPAPSYGSGHTGGRLTPETMSHVESLLWEQAARGRFGGISKAIHEFLDPNAPKSGGLLSGLSEALRSHFYPPSKASGASPPTTPVPPSTGAGSPLGGPAGPSTSMPPTVPLPPTQAAPPFTPPSTPNGGSGSTPPPPVIPPPSGGGSTPIIPPVPGAGGAGSAGVGGSVGAGAGSAGAGAGGSAGAGAAGAGAAGGAAAAGPIGLAIAGGLAIADLGDKMRAAVVAAIQQVGEYLKDRIEDRIEAAQKYSPEGALGVALGKIEVVLSDLSTAQRIGDEAGRRAFLQGRVEANLNNTFTGLAELYLPLGNKFLEIADRFTLILSNASDILAEFKPVMELLSNGEVILKILDALLYIQKLEMELLNIERRRDLESEADTAASMKNKMDAFFASKLAPSFLPSVAVPYVPPAPGGGP